MDILSILPPYLRIPAVLYAYRASLPRLPLLCKIEEGFPGFLGIMVRKVFFLPDLTRFGCSLIVCVIELLKHLVISKHAETKEQWPIAFWKRVFTRVPAHVLNLDQYAAITQPVEPVQSERWVFKSYSTTTLGARPVQKCPTSCPSNSRPHTRFRQLSLPFTQLPST